MCHLFQIAKDLDDGLFYLLRLFLICLGYGSEDAGEPRQVVAIDRREIRASVEGLALRGEKHGQRPTPASGQHLHRVHIDLIHVRPLFAINLDIDEELVHQRGDLLILEGFPLHHMAPVARGIANRKKNRLVLRARLFKGLRSPRVPIDRIMSVLQQVRGLLVHQTIGMHDRCTHRIAGLTACGSNSKW